MNRRPSRTLTAPVSPAALRRLRRARAAGFTILFSPEAFAAEAHGLLVGTAIRTLGDRYEAVSVFADGTAKRICNVPLSSVDVGPEYDGCSERAIELRNHDWTVANWSQEEMDDAMGNNDPALG